MLVGSYVYGFWLPQLCFLIATWQGIVYTFLNLKYIFFSAFLVVFTFLSSFFFLVFLVVFTFLNCKSMYFLALDTHMAVILSTVM